MLERIGIFVLSLMIFGCQSEPTRAPNIKGWNLLSYHDTLGIKAIQKAPEYGINHLQLSHQLIMDLKDVRNQKKLALTRKLIQEAKQTGIPDILVWDHALYRESYYPDRFKTDKNLINLDDPAFWAWVKSDYRSMLDSLPDITGIVLTFIETGAHVEDQYSKQWDTESEKLAGLVDTLASVIIDERGLDLFIRTFMYSEAELDAVIGCVNLIQHPQVKVMTKEVPHDFFLPHPISTFIDRFDKPLLIEFDLGHEYHGQGIIASILPEITVERWKYYAQKSNVLGYVARTDRFNNTQNIGRPTEINLYALKRIAEDPKLSAEQIVEEFIDLRYGRPLIETLKPVFLKTDEIILSSYYTLGLHMNSHSNLNFEHQSNYSRHCSGKWLENPEVHLTRGLDTTLHYWKDVVEHLAPARFKNKYVTDDRKSILFDEAPWVIDSAWVTPQEKMNYEYLEIIVAEKEYGRKTAKWALETITSSKNLFRSAREFNELYQLYERTLITTELYLRGAQAYFGYRAYLVDQNNPDINATIEEGLSGLKKVIEEIRSYPEPGPSGQYSWTKDADRAERLYQQITQGWEVYQNMRYPLN